jgi:tRNA(adenine34) deaminase
MALNTSSFYMNAALAEASVAEKSGDVPIGAVVVRSSDGEIVGRGHNTKERDKDPLGHAEINALSDACKRLGAMYLSDCTLYVTLEPCTMCAGACINAWIGSVVYALKDPKAGAMGSVMSVNSYPLNHKITVEYGVCEEEAGAMLHAFFEKKRTKGKA